MLRRWFLLALAGVALVTALARPIAAASAHTPARDPLHELVVLAYDGIEDPTRAVMPDDAVTPEAFSAQLDWLVGHGYHFVSLDQVLPTRRGRGQLPAHPVLLSFDDGYTSMYTAAFPVLKRQRWWRWWGAGWNPTAARCASGMTGSIAPVC